ncbi:hypothetical protein ACJMK2_029574 [Sinanodonta woodiana]|uniref:Nucleotidyltransferase family protein n=1 Tax=Sinanodonta woodiana TaxID=1069815 RepID=A0ABD3XAK5_SINWO
MASNIPDYYKEVSLRLNRILDAVGLGEDIRWKRINMWIQSEEVASVIYGYEHHCFGSQAEATTTYGLQSDVDYVCFIGGRVIKNLESWMPDVPTLLIVNDEHTPPGYVKLQGVNRYLPCPLYMEYNEQLTLDRYGRSVVCNDNHQLRLDAVDVEIHGPANRFSVKHYLVDNVHGMRLHAWPDQASQWLTRNRQHNWPSHETIRLI